MFFSNARNKRLEAQHFLARLADQGAMDRVRQLEEHRDERRTVLNIGMWVVPVNGANPEIEETFTALATDLSSKGLTIISNRPITAADVLICFPDRSEAKFLRAKVVHSKELGLGWLRVGLEVSEIVEIERHPHLGHLGQTAMA